jgi:hypothetical protein
MVNDNQNRLIPAIPGWGEESVSDSKWWFGKTWNVSLAKYMRNDIQNGRLNDINCPAVIEQTGGPTERSSYGFNHFVGKANSPDEQKRGAMLLTQLVEPSKTIMFGDTEIVGDGFHTNHLLSHDSIHGHHDGFANVSFLMDMSRQSMPTLSAIFPNIQMRDIFFGLVFTKTD